MIFAQTYRAEGGGDLGSGDPGGQAGGDPAPASGGDPASGGVATVPLPSKFELDITGKEFKGLDGKPVDITKWTPEERFRRLQMSIGAEKALQKSSFLERQLRERDARLSEYEAKFQQFEKDPIAFAKTERKVDLEALAQERVLEDWISKNGTPEEKAQWDLEKRARERDSLKAERDELLSSREEEENSRAQAAADQQYADELAGSLHNEMAQHEDIKHLAKDPFVAQRYLFYLRAADRMKMDIAPERLSRLVYKDMVGHINHFLENAPPERLERDLSAKFWERWDAHKIAKVASPNLNGNRAIPQGGIPPLPAGAKNEELTHDDLWKRLKGMPATA